MPLTQEGQGTAPRDEKKHLGAQRRPHLFSGSRACAGERRFVEVRR